MTTAYILKASPVAPTGPEKNLIFHKFFLLRTRKMAQKWPKMTQNGPKWPKYDPKWPKNDPKWPENFPQFLLTEKAVPQTFSLLECMMLRWYGHSVSGSGPEPCQVSTLLLGDTGPPFQLIGRLLLSPHPKKQCEKVNHLSFKVFWATETDWQVEGKSFHGVWICGQKCWQIIPALICLHLWTFLCVKKNAGALLTI